LAIVGGLVLVILRRTLQRPRRAELPVAEVLLFHHAQGLTPGVQAFAARLRESGHVVHVPDLYEGKVFDDLEAGIAHAETVGFGEILEQGRRAADDLPTDLVYAGFSLGVLPAQLLAQTRAGAKGALFFHSCVPPEDLGGTWPVDLPVQIHAMADDPLFVGEGDVEAARALVLSVAEAELFLYPGDQHLFADNSLPGYDAAATATMEARVSAFLSSFS
jgi:dienelactone hydrolase